LADAATIEAISDMKNRRAEFATVTPEMLRYNSDECQMLAQLMTRFREHCYALGIYPKEWSTAGFLAQALMVSHHVPKRSLSAEERKAGQNSGRTPRWPERDPKFETAARYGYFAGRQEATRAGHVRSGCFRQDIHSAYPSKLLELPCQMHMHVRRSRSKTPPVEALYIGWGHFQHPPDTVWGGLPVRGDNGGVYWPLEACGWWWSPEIRSAQQHLGMTIKFEEIWIVEWSCQCDTFGSVRDLYEERLQTAACAYHNLKRAARWETITPKYGFGWRGKHDTERFDHHGDEVWLWPQKGSMLIESRPYKAGIPDIGRDAARALMDAMPDLCAGNRLSHGPRRPVKIVLGRNTAASL
jgi:hypothetical protein